MDKEFFILYFVASDALLSGRLVPCKWNQAWRPSELYMCIEREKDNFKSREVNCLKECALALNHMKAKICNVYRSKLVTYTSVLYDIYCKRPFSFDWNLSLNLFPNIFQRKGWIMLECMYYSTSRALFTYIECYLIPLMAVYGSSSDNNWIQSSSDSLYLPQNQGLTAYQILDKFLHCNMVKAWL